MIPIHRTNTILYCQRWAETVTFYQETFQFPVNFKNDWFIEFQIGTHMYLSIANAERATIRHVEGQGITLSWQVDNIEDIYRELQQKDFALGDRQSKWNANLFYLHDPEGHRIELWEPHKTDV